MLVRDGLQTLVIQVDIYVCIHIHRHTCIYVDTYISVHIYQHVNVHLCVYIYV